MKTERSHYIELRLEDQLGMICLHVSITAIIVDECDSGLPPVDDMEIIRDKKKEFSLWKTPKVLNEIGWLQV